MSKVPRRSRTEACTRQSGWQRRHKLRPTFPLPSPRELQGGSRHIVRVRGIALMDQEAYFRLRDSDLLCRLLRLGFSAGAVPLMCNPHDETLPRYKSPSHDAGNCAEGNYFALWKFCPESFGAVADEMAVRTISLVGRPVARKREPRSSERASLASSNSTKSPDRAHCGFAAVKWKDEVV